RDIRIEEPFSRSSPRMILAADPGKKRVALVREIAIGQHELVWERPIEVCRDLQLLGNKVLYQDTESRVRALDLKSGDLAWSFDAAAHWGQDAEIQSFCRTYDGLYMVARSSPPQLLEFDTDGVVHREIELQVQDMVGPSNLSMVRPTYLNGYVVTHPDSGMVREYKRDGELLWRYEVPLFGIDSVEGQGPDAWGNQCYLALSRSETHTMLTTGNGHGLIEVAKDGTVLKRIQQSDLPDVQLAWTTTIQLLEDDQLVLGNRHAGPDQPQLIEFDIDWNVTWTFNNHDLFSDSMTCAVVIEDTKVQNAWR
ncbi:MAG: PQQ-binding-like beta-propeller repeat protein, partial [Ilumatobacter sp.]|nr:PQQ-binding-like beta-propeller repeat protein [Ilumatobacter sp.]